MGVLLSADNFQNFAGEVLSTVVADGDAQEILTIVVEGVPYVGFPSDLGRSLPGSSSRERNSYVALAIRAGQLVDDVVSVVASFAGHGGDAFLILIVLLYHTEG